MSTAARFTCLVVGAVAVTLILAAAISAAMDGGNLLPTLGHTVAIRTTPHGQPGDGSQNGVTAAPPAIIPLPQPAAGADRDEAAPGDVQNADRDRGEFGVTTLMAPTDGHDHGHGDHGGSGDGHDSGGRGEG